MTYFPGEENEVHGHFIAYAVSYYFQVMELGTFFLLLDKYPELSMMFQWYWEIMKNKIQFLSGMLIWRLAHWPGLCNSLRNTLSRCLQVESMFFRDDKIHPQLWKSPTNIRSWPCRTCSYHILGGNNVHQPVRPWMTWSCFFYSILYFSSRFISL